MWIKNFMVYGIVTLAMVLWSMTFIWYKLVFETLNPISVMTIRLGVSALLLIVFSAVIGKLKRIQTGDIKWFIALSFFQPFLYFMGESFGVNLVTSTVAAVIISTIPVFTPIMAYLFFGDKIGVLNVFGILVSFIGVLMVLLGQNLHFGGSILGVILLIGSVLSALGYSVIIVRLTTKYSSFTIISWQNLIGFFMFLPFFLVVDLNHFLNADLNGKVLLNLGYLAVLGSSVAYICFTYSIKILGITKASIFTNLIPIFTAALAYYLLNEHLTWFKFLGIMVVIAGLLLGQKTPKKLKNITV